MKRKRNRKPQTPRKARAGGPAPDRKPGLLYNGLPSSGKMSVNLTPDGWPQLIYPSRMSLTEEMWDKLQQMGQSYWYPRAEPISAFRPRWIVNTLADADIYPHALEALDAALKDNPVPVFNHPFAVLKTRRDYVWNQLSDVPNLISPKCVRFLADSPNRFLRVFEQSGFSFPVIIRPCGSHTGQDMILVESKEDWPKIFSIPWGGLEMYMTQWVDFQSDAGEWRKLRLCLTPDTVSLRHILFGDGWMIHAMDRGNDIVDRELEIMNAAEDWEVLQQIGADIRDRVGLDYCGVDLGYKSEREFVLFEANPSMSVLSRYKTPEYRRSEYEANIVRIESRVWQSVERFVQTAVQ